jgi:hypothetical protein
MGENESNATVKRVGNIENVKKNENRSRIGSEHKVGPEKLGQSRPLEKTADNYPVVDSDF